MSQYYQATNRAATSCNFGGNATVNPNAPSSASGAAGAVSSCIANPGAVFTPTAGATGGGGGSPTGKPTSTGKSGAVSLSLDTNAFFGLGVATIFSLIGAVWTLV